MIAPPHVKYDTFDVRASERNVNYDTFDIDVLQNSTQADTL